VNDTGRLSTLAFEIAGLTIFPKKDAPGVALSEMRLVEGLGAEGDFHQGGDRQISLLTVAIRQWMNAQDKQGICFARYKENILIKGLPLEDLINGRKLAVGDVLLRIDGVGKKHCFNECILFSEKAPCLLAGGAVFALVERSGFIRVGDDVTLLL